MKGENAGYYGRLHPKICTELNIPINIYIFEIVINKILKKKKTCFKKISKYPSVKRDISIIISDEIRFEDVMKCAENYGTNLLLNVELFDVYQGESIEKGKKSLALRLTFQATSSTLTDEVIEAIMKKLVASLNNNFGAKLRD